jgi:hypothetical protein
VMKRGKVDLFVDELIRLASELHYDGVHVKDKARVGMTTELRNAWALKTPHPELYIDYLNLLRNTGHQLEDVANFNQTVVREKHTSHHDKGDERPSGPRKQRKKEKGSGNRNPKPTYNSSGPSRPRNSEYEEKHRNVPSTLTDKRRRLKQCTRCGQEGHFWRNCTSVQPVVHSSKPSRKRTATEAGHVQTTVPKARRIEAPPPPQPVVKKAVTELRGSPPLLEVDTDASD